MRASLILVAAALAFAAPAAMAQSYGGHGGYGGAPSHVSPSYGNQIRGLGGFHGGRGEGFRQPWRGYGGGYYRGGYGYDNRHERQERRERRHEFRERNQYYGGYGH